MDLHKRSPGEKRPRPIIRRRRIVREYARLAGIVLCVAVAIFCIVSLIRYVSDFFSSSRRTEQIRQEYYAAEDTPEATAAPDIAATPAPTAAPKPTPSPRADIPEVTSVPYVPAPTAAPTADLSRYENNPQLTVSARFSKVRKQNKDIVAWLSMAGILDQAVVQRDNSYYLRRDYLGYHNDNGSLFLDENCDLEKRPAISIIWGHNMKTGAMFGCLRQYENEYFLHKNPFITFNTIYEDGEYVIFAVSKMNAATMGEMMLRQNSPGKTADLLRQIVDASMYTCPVDVKGDDQLLILATCTGEDSTRRIVAARRIRDYETRETLESQVGRTKKR